jgi:hypothetical protein
MESTRQQPPSLELWLLEVQSYISRVTSGPLKQAGFHFNRSNFSYKRKNKKSQDLLSIIFLSEFPVNYRLGFQLEIWHPQIRHVKESFMNEILNRESNLCSIILFNKDFPISDTQQEVLKDYSLYNHKDLFMVGDWLSQTLQYELIPICDQMDTIEHLDGYFEAKPFWSLNTHSGGNICTDLIVAMLNHKRDLHARYQELMQGIQQKIESRQMNPESRELLSLCYDTIKPNH